MEQQCQECNNDNKCCGLLSRSALTSKSMEDLLKALLSEEMEHRDFDDVFVAPPVPSVSAADDHLQVATADSSNKELVVRGGGGGGSDDEDEEEDHRVRRGHHCQTRSDAGSSAGPRTDQKRGIRDHPKNRNRTMEMHNLTERRRREKIKWKLKELQKLVPNSNNMDKASMLEEAIRYMKSLQQEVKALSTTGLGVLCQTPPPYMQPLPAVQCMRLTGYPLFIPTNTNTNTNMNMNMSAGMTTGLLPMVDPPQPIRFFAPLAIFPPTPAPSPEETSTNHQVGHLIHSSKG